MLPPAVASTTASPARTRPSSGQTGKELDVIGIGTSGVVVKGKYLPHGSKVLWQADHQPLEGAPLATKILFSEDDAMQEIDMARALSIADSRQRYLLYPFAIYEAPTPIRAMQALFSVIPRGEQDNPYVDGIKPLGTKVYLAVMQDGGRSVAVHRDDGDSLTKAQAFRLLGDYLFGLSLLHNERIAHGDIHIYNAVYEIDADGNARGFWIDFGHLKNNASPEAIMGDVKKAGQVVGMILGMVRDGTHDPDIEQIRKDVGRFRVSVSLGSLLHRDSFQPIHPRTDGSSRAQSRMGTPVGSPRRPLFFGSPPSSPAKRAIVSSPLRKTSDAPVYLADSRKNSPFLFSAVSPAPGPAPSPAPAPAKKARRSASK